MNSSRRPRQTPALAGRSLILGHHAFMAEVADWVQWAARNRLNTIFFHIDEHGLGLGAISATQWRAGRAAAVALARAYGMTLELGGHGLPSLLPRDAFAEHPDWFPSRGGHREQRFNFNALSADALAVVRTECCRVVRRQSRFRHLSSVGGRSARWRLVRRSDGARLYALRPADARHQRRRRSAGRGRTGALLAFLSYHDTEAPPSVAPHGQCRAHLRAAPALLRGGHRCPA